MDAFEGPLDLLLTLIDKNEIDIYDIPVHIVTSQFIDHIKMWEEMNLDVASDFILMAASLLELKSRMLLPKELAVVDGEEIEIDPREELMRKLLEYKLYKEIAQEFKKNESVFSRVYYKPQEDISDFRDPFDELNAVEIDDLVSALSGILEKYRYKNPSASIFELEREEITLEECYEDIHSLLQGRGSFKFSTLIEMSRSRTKVIAYFLSLLEMMRLRMITVKQDRRNADLIIEKKD
jgi:segregation and condensation protein A